MPTKLHFILSFILLCFLPACAPKVYVIDRATILEEESGGEWPQVDTMIRQKVLKTTPSAVKTSEASDRKSKLTRTLEPDESTAPKKTEKE